MIAVWNKTQIEDHLTRSFKERYKRKDVNITGILFARPELKAAQDQVLPNLDHWNYRSDYYTEFFCVGFAPLPTDRKHKQKAVVTVGGTRWHFSAESFNEVLTDIESQTKWRYRSGCYLIIANTRYDKNTRRARVDFRRALVINIPQAVKSGAVETADELAELFFAFAKKINEGDTKDPVWEFSDAMGVSVLRKSLIDYLLEWFPKPARALFRKGEQFVVQELEPA